MRIQDLKGKTVCILGFGREGKAMLGALKTYAPDATVTVRDEKDGADYLKSLEKYDVIIKSPGIPPKAEFAAVKKKMTSSTQIFFDSIKGSGALTIGVTGSKGKSTTSSLIYEILKADKRDVHLVGNIGEPSIAHIADAKPKTIFVIEMSSYQLMDLTVSPSIAVVTAIFPEHLDYHGSFEAYRDAKKNILRFQRAGDKAFYDVLPGMLEVVDVGQGEKIPYEFEDCPVEIEETKLLGKHNCWNMAGARKVTESLGVPLKTIVATLKKFTGLPHRLQDLGTHHGIRWVNDSIATAPEPTIFGIEAMHWAIGSLILGGQDRGNDFTELGETIATYQNIQTAIVFPGSGPRIADAIANSLKKHFSKEEREHELNIYQAETMEMAVELAKHHTPKGMICLLSPASPSYGFFKNFEERGEKFKEAIGC